LVLNKCTYVESMNISSGRGKLRVYLTIKKCKHCIRLLDRFVDTHILTT